MSIPVPLGVRIYSAPASYDMWVTRYMEDFSIRSTAPGGFASATFKYRRYNPVEQPDVIIWNPTTSAVSANTTSFKVLDANATLINVGDRFWAFTTGGAIRFGGERYRVTGKSSAGGTTTVTYYPATPTTIASGETVTAKVASSFYDSGLTGFNKMLTLYNGVQVVDLQTMEVAFEGRIEQPARETELNVWTLNVLGTSVIATDIERPMFYIESSMEKFYQNDGQLPGVDMSVNAQSNSITQNEKWVSTEGPYAADSWSTQNFICNTVESCELEGYARVSATFSGIADHGSPVGRLSQAFGFIDYGRTGDQMCALARVALNAGVVKTTRTVGNSYSGSPGNIFPAATYPQVLLVKFNEIELGYGNGSNASTVQNTAPSPGSIRDVFQQPARKDRFGNLLTTAASYPGDYVTVPQVVEDVLGRFLVGGWFAGGMNTPYGGKVAPENAYIDTSSTARMVSGLTWYEGTTAKEILDTLTTNAQPNAYWAIWETQFGATDDGAKTKARFEWATWPDSWGYLFTSQDGLSEAPDGENQYSFVWEQWIDGSYNESPETNEVLVRNWWNTDICSDLDAAQLTRAKTIQRGAPLPTGGNIAGEANQWLLDNSLAVNSGSITIKRPVQYYDSGLDSYTGGSGMKQPWMIRPGKLARIIDLPPRAGMNDFAHNGNLPNRALGDCVFKIVAVTYNTSDNSATVELDQNVNWDTPQQIVRPVSGNGGTIYR